jgi:hypothetical protein
MKARYTRADSMSKDEKVGKSMGHVENPMEARREKR